MTITKRKHPYPLNVRKLDAEELQDFSGPAGDAPGPFGVQMWLQGKQTILEQYKIANGRRTSQRAFLATYASARAAKQAFQGAAL